MKEWLKEWPFIVAHQITHRLLLIKRSLESHSKQFVNPLCQQDLVAAISTLVIVKLDINFHEQFLPIIIKDVLLQAPYDTAIFSQILAFSIIGLPIVLRAAALDVMQIYTRRA